MIVICELQKWQTPIFGVAFNFMITGGLLPLLLLPLPLLLLACLTVLTVVEAEIGSVGRFCRARDGQDGGERTKPGNWGKHFDEKM